VPKLASCLQIADFPQCAPNFGTPHGERRAYASGAVTTKGVELQLSAWFFLGAWFLYQLIEANFGIFGSAANGGGVAFFAHVGGFLFGALVAWLLTRAGLVAPQDRSGALRAPA
jgi:membrane associated rhomboid family serine protease